MNPRNSIWHDADAVNAYAARVQSVLQSGQPDNDILLYYNAADFWMQPGDKLLPQLTVHARDWFEGQPIGKVAKELWDRGYAFDYVSDAQLKTAKVADGKIQMPGDKYEMVIVPQSKFIPLETFKGFLALAESGATILFWNDLPEDVSGANDAAKKQIEYKLLKSKLSFQKNKYPIGFANVAQVGLGKLVCTDIPLLGEPATFEFGLSCICRAFDGGWNYFVANRTATNVDCWTSFNRDGGDSVIVLDPMTGSSGLAARNKRGSVHVQINSGESIILRFFKSRKMQPKIIEGPAWNYWQTSGQPIELTGQWNVKFLEGGPTLPADFQTAKLASWTTFPDTNCQSFGGTAKYETTFDAPNPHSALRTPQFFLDLGDVRQSARVRVNGRDYGTLITPPFRVIVNDLKPAGNTLEVEVTSVDANRIRDLDRRGVKWKVFRDINLVNMDYKPFNAAKWPLTDCGLLGPVTLTPVSAGR